jgi:hypothetical protein
MAYNTLFTKASRKRSGVIGIGSKSGKAKQERSKTGFEMEFLLVDNEGGVSNEADKVLNHIESNELKHEAVKECCHSYIEMGVYPRIYVRNVATKFLEDILGVLDVAEKFDISFFPMAMYPYKYEPMMRKSDWYGVKEKIFGEKWGYAGRCAGFHFHYSLPEGIFNWHDRHLNEKALRSEKQKTVNAYNFGIAIDPAITTLTQSSPLFQGKYLAKGSRLLLYRGGDALKYDGLYSSYQAFGGLQNYVATYEELITRSEKKHETWMDIVKKAGGDMAEVDKKNKLDISWNPVKVNKVGSIELRNMDMNFPSTLMAVAILTKYALRDIQRKEIEIVTDNVAIREPFKFEEGEKTKIYVPPFWHVNTVLQKEAAWNGLEEDIVYDYCKGFWSLCLRFTNKKYYPMLKPLKDMLKKRKTRSDEILDLIKKKGHNPKEEVPEEVLREIVLSYSRKLRKDIEVTKTLMESLTEGDRQWL